ncbi:unnamed protein product [Calypogeia fissa]
MMLLELGSFSKAVRVKKKDTGQDYKVKVMIRGTSIIQETSVDMWALGCVIFPMLDGKTPLNAASEYLTFQKVMSRDLAMPQQFHPEAKDLIDKLLAQCPVLNWVEGVEFCSFYEEDLVPEKRPDFATTQKHHFASGVTWSDLWTLPAPSLTLPSGQIDEDWDTAQLQAGLEAFALS